MNRDIFIEKLLSRAKQAGFEAGEIYISDVSSFKTGVHLGEITRYSVSDKTNLGFRGLYRGKMGCASTQVLDESAIDMLVSAAKDGAELCEMDDEEFIYGGDSAYPEIDGENPAIGEISAAEKIEMAKKLERKALDYDPRITSCSACGVMSMEAATRMVNSRGLDLSVSRGCLGAYVLPIARDGEKTGTSGRECLLMDPSKLDLDALAAESAEEALAYLDAASVPSGKYPILLRHDMAAELLGTFSSVFSADAAQKGMSLLKGREGERIAAECVRIMDDPLLKGNYYSRPFDGEGVACRPKAIVESGRLTTLLHNLKTAKKQGVQTTGNASRSSCAGPIGVSPGNFFFAPGEAGAEELYAMAGSGLLITDLMGMHSGANAVSGDFSLGAKGFLIENGKIARSVNQITIAGNFFELLKDIEALGSDLDFGGGCFGSPTLLVRALSVAGK